MPILPTVLGGLFGGSIAARFGMAASGVGGNPFLKQSITQRFFKLPLVQGGSFGVGYTSGAYGGYGVTNTADPFGLHKPKYKYTKMKLGMPYGRYGYRRFRRYRRYGSRYGYRRRSFYRRRYY